MLEELVFLDGENKVGDIFSQLLGNKMANSDHGNAVPNGQQKHQNVPAGCGALVKPVTVNIRDGQNVTAITEASRICHVADTDLGL